MAENLAQYLVGLRYRSFGADTPVKLGLDHVERRFDVEPLVIVAKVQNGSSRSALPNENYLSQ